MCKCVTTLTVEFLNFCLSPYLHGLQHVFSYGYLLVPLFITFLTMLWLVGANEGV